MRHPKQHPSAAARSVFLFGLALLPLVHLRAQTQWRRLAIGASPPPRHQASMAYDPVRDRCLMVGGIGDAGPTIADAWEWDGSAWQRVPYPVRFGHFSPPMAHDPVGGGILVLLFDNAGLPSTWRWNGGWTQVATAAQSPPLGSFAESAISTAPGGVLVFGGGSLPMDETWFWDGARWTRQGSVVTPPGRRAAHMAYDARRQRVLMSGGTVPPVLFNDTWSWDRRNGWTPVAVGPSPSFWRMEYDHRRDRMVKVGWGGGPSSGSPGGPPSGYAFGTYEFDGGAVRWDARAPVGAPSGRSGFAMAYDQARGQVVMFGGFPGMATDETWVYEPVVAASFQTNGPGCSGAGLPALTTTMASGLPWSGQRFEVAVSNVPGPTRVPVARLMMVGGSISRWGAVALPLDLGGFGLPGCRLLVSPDVISPLVALPGGGWGWAADIPPSPGLLGRSFYLQALVSSVAQPAQLVVSDAGLALIGGL